MRFYCHVHKRSFSASPLAPVECEKGEHLLGNAPADPTGYDIWEYCCDCQNFWLVSPDGPGASQCPVCERGIASRFLCHSCNTVSLETTAPANGRSIFFSLQGLPRPYCPGCRNSESRKPSEHSCEAYKFTFSTFRSECLFCKESITTVPSFPMTVRKFLSQAAGELLEVDFDPHLTGFINSTSGKFVLAPGGKFLPATILLPGVERFDSAESFKTFEQSYICDEPNAGEIVIDYPATVSREGNTWILKTAGRLRVELERPVEQIPLNEWVECRDCSAPIKNSYKFCKRCGSRVTGAETN